jgi:hypothetical protein
MSTPTGDPDTGATKPMTMFRASGDAVGVYNSIAATDDITMITITATTSTKIFFRKYQYLSIFPLLFKGAFC